MKEKIILSLIILRNMTGINRTAFLLYNRPNSKVNYFRHQYASYE